MFIFEGMDNTGKSTAAYSLAKKLKKIVVHSPGQKYGKHTMAKWAEVTLESPADRYIIYDRHPIISEAVYGEILRGYSIFDHPDYKNILRKFKETTNIIIYCRPPREKIFNFRKEEMDGVTAQANELLMEYDRLFLSGEFQTMNDNSLIVRYDWTKDDIMSKITDAMGSHISNFLGKLFKEATDE